MGARSHSRTSGLETDTYKALIITLRADFKRKADESSKMKKYQQMLRENNFQPKIVYLTKLSRVN